MAVPIVPRCPPTGSYKDLSTAALPRVGTSLRRPRVVCLLKRLVGALAWRQVSRRVRNTQALLVVRLVPDAVAVAVERYFSRGALKRC